MAEILNSKENLKQQISNVWKLSIPAILTQISSIVMQYIDSAMVGNLGEEASASIGLVSTSTWLLGGLISAVSVGFSVQVVHAFGRKNHKEGRTILKHGLVSAIIISLLLEALSYTVITNLLYPFVLTTNSSLKAAPYSQLTPAIHLPKSFT